jgi:hypothetical protein
LHRAKGHELLTNMVLTTELVSGSPELLNHIPDQTQKRHGWAALKRAVLEELLEAATTTNGIVC